MIKFSDPVFQKKNLFYPEGNSFVASFIENKNSLFLICFPIGILLAMTIPISSRSYWDDEIFSILTSRSWESMTEVFRKYENNMAFYYVILFLWMKLFGDGELATRFLSIFISLISIYFFFKLACKIFNKTTAFFATILLVCNPIFLFYSVETRSYSLLLMLIIVATYIYLQILQQPYFRLGVLYGLLVGSAVYTHYFGILIVPVHFIALSCTCLKRRHLYLFSLSLLIIVFLLLPLLIFKPESMAQVDWIGEPAFKNLIFVISALFGGKYILLCLVTCLLYILWESDLIIRISKINFFLPVLSITWVCIPACIMFLFSIFIKPAFLDRYFIWCLPGAIFIVSMIIIKLPIKSVWKPFIFTVPILILLVQSYQKLIPKGSGYRDAAVFLSNEVKPKDAVITYPFYKAIHYSFYLSTIKKGQPYLESKSISPEVFLPGGGGRDLDPDFEKISEISKISDRVFVICITKAREADQRLNRVWLPLIKEKLSQQHPVQKSITFMPNSLEPIMVLIFE